MANLNAAVIVETPIFENHGPRLGEEKRLTEPADCGGEQRKDHRWDSLTGHKIDGRHQRHGKQGDNGGEHDPPQNLWPSDFDLHVCALCLSGGDMALNGGLVQSAASFA